MSGCEQSAPVTTLGKSQSAFPNRRSASYAGILVEGIVFGSVHLVDNKGTRIVGYWLSISTVEPAS